MNQIINGAPFVNALGINDKSIRALAVEPEAIPTHLPKVYIFAQKGRRGPQLVVGSGRDAVFGTDTFDPRKSYFNHQTMLSNLVNAEGNAQMIERIFPSDMGPKANFRLSIDLLPTTVPLYQRDGSGNIVLKQDGSPTPLTPAQTTPGYKVKWVLSNITSNLDAGGDVIADSDLYGAGATAVGDQTDGQAQSNRYPILEFWADSEGAFYNNSGFRIWAPNENSAGGVNTSIIGTRRVYPFRMAAISRAAANETAKIKETLAGESYFDFTLKSNVINPSTDAQFSLQDIYLDKYQSTGDRRFVPQYADFSGFKIYQDNIDTVLSMLYAVEKDFIGQPGQDFDILGDEETEKWLFNLFTLTSSSGTPYYASVLNTTDANAIRLSESTNIWAKGGGDGTMSAANFNSGVSAAVSEYANKNSNLMNSAINVESIMYDTGFPLAVKYDLCKFISERKNTFVVLSTIENGQPIPSNSEQNSIAVALRTRLQLYPESDYFGTQVTRGMIIGRSGKLRNSNYKEKLPLTLELAIKAARMMGAGNRRWKPEYLFDKAPNSIITNFDLDQVDNPYVPAQQRNKDWDVGLNYPQDYSRSAMYFPALKTVYGDDTSVLNSFFTAMACVELQRVGERAHRQFSGSISLTNAQLIDRVNKFVEDDVNGRFADLFKIKSQAYITSADDLRGYSWTLPIQLYANNMKTVMSLSIESYRMSDFTD